MAKQPAPRHARPGFLSIRQEFIGQPERVKQIFLETATSLGRAPYFEGRGLVDLMRAIQSVWEVEFDEAGRLTNPGDAPGVAGEVRASPITDLFVLCHGWNNSRRNARKLFTGFFQEMRDVLDQRCVRRPTGR